MRYPSDPDCGTCQMYGECICMADWTPKDQAELEATLQPLIDKIDDFILVTLP